MVYFSVESAIFIEFRNETYSRVVFSLLLSSACNYKYQGIFHVFNDQLSQRNAITKQLIKSAMAFYFGFIHFHSLCPVSLH